MIGALVMAFLRNGSQQMGWPNYMQEIIIGVIIVAGGGAGSLRAGREWGQVSECAGGGGRPPEPARARTAMTRMPTQRPDPTQICELGCGVRKSVMLLLMMRAS